MWKNLPGLKLVLISFMLVSFCGIFVATAQCNDPTNLKVSSIGSTSAFVSWNPVTGAQSYRIGVKVKGTANFSTIIETTNNFYSLTGLLTGMTYEWGVRTICSETELSNLPFGPEFTTTGAPACAEPAGLSANVTSDTEVSFDWNDATGVTSYTFAYRKRHEGVGWEFITSTTSSSLDVTGLQSGTNYVWGVRTICSDINAQSELIFGPEFTTTGANRCEDPTGLATSNITDNTADLSWNAAVGAENYRVAYRESGEEAWLSFFEVGTTSTTISGLSIATTYEWAIRTLCPAEGTVSELIFGTDFTTTGACDDPTNLAVSNVTDTEARFDWDVAAGAINYRVAYRVAGRTGFDVITTTTNNFFDVTGLLSGTNYEWAIRTLCDAAEESNLIFGAQFTTTGGSSCEDPTNLAATVLGDTSVQLDWDDVGGSTDYRVAYRRQSVGGPWEVITTTGGPNTYTATGLIEGTNYEWAIRNLCSGIESNLILGPLFTTTGGSPVCEDPANLAVSNIVDNGADFDWDVAVGATSYRFAYKKLGQTKWETILIVTTNSLSVGSLQSGTSYEWAVRSLCNNDLESNLILGSSFTTTGSGPSCDDPTNHSVTGITTSGATLQWDVVSGAITYRVAYREAGTPLPWDVITTVSTNSYNATGLLDGTTYTWAVIATCSDLESSLVLGPNFTTLTPQIGNSDISINSKTSSSEELFSETDILVYPNPSDGLVRVKVFSNSDYQLLVYDVLGNLLITSKADQYQQERILDLRTYRSGVYILKFAAVNKVATRSILIQ